MGKAKKLSKKEKAKLEAEQAETLRVEMEKERLKKMEEDRERKMRERRDAKKKQQQEAVENKLRRVQLRESSHALKKSKQEIKKLLAEEKLNIEWEQYMRCNGLPNASDPSDLRKYIHMWIWDFKESNKKEINWLLKVNEQSILTQDQTVPDLSKESLKKFQPEMGEMYAKRANEVLGILDEMDAIIRDQYSLSPSKLKDLLDLKLEIRSILASFIDEFTFRILGNIERNMTLSGLNVATYTFISSVFKMELYTLREIPIPLPSNPKEKMKEEKTHIEFSNIQMNLTLPPSVRVVGSAIRALWLNYDHLSDYCNSTIFKYDDGDRKKLTLRKTTKREWKKRKELLQKALHQIFNEKPDESAEDPNLPRQIDIDKMYTEYEDGLNVIERGKMGPDSLGLGEFEVNLRRNKIVGGVYQIEYLEQPLQDIKADEGALLRTLIHPIKLGKKQFHYPYRAPDPPVPGQKRTPEEIELEIKTSEENMERMALVNIDLPSHVSWFEPPIVCRFETEEEFLEMKEYDEELSRKKRMEDDDFDETEDDLDVQKKARKSEKEAVIKKPTKEKDVKVVEDFNLLEVPKNVNLKPLLEEFVIPMTPEGYEIQFKPKKSSSEAVDCYTDRMYAINDIVYQTRQPRPLFPSCKTKKVLKVVKRHNSLEFTSNLELSSDEENDESMYSVDSDPHALGNKANIYMFSKFMRDLEELIDMEQPAFEKKITEMSSNLSMPTPEVKQPPPPTTTIDRKDSGISLTKTNSKSLLEGSDDDNSDIDSETDDDEEENKEIARCLLIDKIVKEANIKRCRGRWSTREIHEVKFNEDKLTIQFRTGRLGSFALALNRYCNFPFQSWELKPEFKGPGTGTIIFTLTAAQLVMEVSVTDKGIVLNTLQGSNNPAVLSTIIGTTIKLDELIKLMRNAACDVFASDDAFCYTENSCEKNFIMEMHIYLCMAYFASSHNFAWSRWNSQAGSRTAIFLMRELVENRKLPNQSSVHITPFKACLIDCTEVSPNYCSTPIPSIEYFADLYQLILSSIQPVSKSKTECMSPLLRQNVFELMKSIRPLSFC